MATRVVSLTIGTREDDEWKHVFEMLSQIGAELGVTHHYASVTSVDTDANDVDDVDPDELTDDENTLAKVRIALHNTLWGKLPVAGFDDVIMDIVNDLQNMGIFFRERQANLGLRRFMEGDVRDDAVVSEPAS